MDNKWITGIIGVVVVVALLGSALVPVIDGLTEGEKTTNEGAGWIRMDYVTGESYDANVSFDPQGNIRVDTGVPGSGIVNTQTHSADEDTILFASSEVTMWLQDGVINILGKDSDGNVFFDQITEIGSIATVMRDGTGSQFSIDTEVPTQLNASSWAYVPKSTGNFGFFDAGTPVEMKDYPVAAVGGGFAGVYASNAAAMYGLPLQMQTELDDNGKLIAAYWEKASDLEQLNTMEFDPSTITIQPLDPSIIDLDTIDFDGGAQLMSVPTPTYTDGDWGYDLTQVDGVDKAIIVSYSGVGNIDVTIPATVGGYDVYKLGKGSNMEIFDQNTTFTSITISDGIEIIGNSAFMGARPGQVSIPDSVTTIEKNAFYYSLVSGDLILPDSVTYVGDSAFRTCSQLRGTLKLSNNLTYIGSQAFSDTKFTGTVIIPSSVTTIKDSAFRYNSNLTDLIIVSDATPGGSNVFSGTSSSLKVLDLSTVTYAPGTYGLNVNATVSESIGDAIGYISFIEIGSEAQLSGGAAALLIAVPVVVIAGLLVAFVGYSIVKRY